MLRFDQHIPANVKEGAPLFVLLHGRGSHKGDLMGLQPYLPPEAMVVAPEAPFPGAAWGYGPGWAWYRFLGHNRPEPESFEASQQQLHSFLAELTDRLPVKPGPVILGGFSQGGTMSLAYALRHPGTVPYVVNLSGFLADHPSVVVTPERLKGTRIFWGHGKQDPAIPFALAVEGRAALKQAGADLTARDYPMGHGVDETELRDLLQWLRQ
ncbi:MAG: alpha/beta hydrolase [Bacillota bacterium]